MHVRTQSALAHPGKLEQAIQVFRDSLVPETKQQRGFKNFRLLTDSTTGKIRIISKFRGGKNCSSD